MSDKISRTAVIQALECFKVNLGDIVLRWVIDRCIEIIRRLPSIDEKEGTA